MSNVEEFPIAARRTDRVRSLGRSCANRLDAIPGGVYVCDHEGWLVRWNSEARRLWGREPSAEEPKDHFCGSHRLFRLDGTPLPHDDCPMAEAIRTGAATRNAEVVIERPDGSRVVALVNIRPLRDHRGTIQGAINCFQDISASKDDGS